jgi:hypothetical protein
VLGLCPYRCTSHVSIADFVPGLVQTLLEPGYVPELEYTTEENAVNEQGVPSPLNPSSARPRHRICSQSPYARIIMIVFFYRP